MLQPPWAIPILAALMQRLIIRLEHSHHRALVMTARSWVVQSTLTVALLSLRCIIFKHLINR